MALSVDYSTPVRVNGYSCKNCSEVDTAKRHIDPAHPRSGADNNNANLDPSRNATDPIKVAAARKAADSAKDNVIGYSPAGYRTDAIAPGSAFSLRA